MMDREIAHLRMPKNFTCLTDYIYLVNILIVKAKSKEDFGTLSDIEIGQLSGMII